MKPRQPFGHRQQGGEVQERLRALMRAKLGKHRARHCMFNRDREQRPEDHICGGVGGLRLDFNRRAIRLGAQPRDTGLPCRPHRGESIAQPPALKGGVDDPALAFPRRAIGQEHAIAQKRGEAFADPVRFREIAGALFQHQINQLRVVAKVGAEERCAEFGHPGAVEARGLGRENIGAEQLEILPERDILGP